MDFASRRDSFSVLEALPDVIGFFCAGRENDSGGNDRASDHMLHTIGELFQGVVPGD